MKKLDKLNAVLGSIQPPSISGAQSCPFTLSITLLSPLVVSFPSRLDPSSLPLLRSLHLDDQTCQPIQLLLPQLASLRIKGLLDLTDLGSLIQASTSITSLALYERFIARLDDASQTFVKKRIVEFSIQVSIFGESSDSTLATIIAGSKAMKKVILDAGHLHVEGQVAARFLAALKVVKAACKKKGVELWKESFEVGNGKVDSREINREFILCLHLCPFIVFILCSIL
jgi:hypothetical protein